MKKGIRLIKNNLFILNTKILLKENYIPIVLCTSFFSLWNYFATGIFSIGIIFYFFCFVVLIIFSGHLFVHFTNIDKYFPTALDSCVIILCGYTVLNSLLLIFSYIFPLGIQLNFFLVALIIVICQFFVRYRYQFKKLGYKDLFRLEYLVIIIILISSTLWSMDSINPIYYDNNFMILKPKSDSFWHASVIRNITNSNNLTSVNNILFSDYPLGFYNVGSYLFPSVLTTFTKLSSYLSHTSFLTPFGVFLMGLAAYSLVKYWWGDFPAFAATLILLTFPDASTYGIKNSFLSFFWLTQVSPSLMYGIAVIVLSWIFLFISCKERKFNFLVISYIFCILCLFYKAHVFVANAFLLWIFPSLFYKKISIKIRIIWFFSSLTIFKLAIDWSQSFVTPYFGIPIISLDFSSIKFYMNALVSLINNANFSTFFSQFTPSFPIIHDVFFGILLLSFGTFGLFSVIYPIVLIIKRKKISFNIIIFSILIFVNYIIMALGLRVNNSQNPFELLHRQFVWAYFIILIWSVGAIFYSINFDGFLKIKFWKIFGIIIILLLFLFPIHFGRDIQVLKGRDNWLKYVNNRIPVALEKCCHYIIDHSRKNEILQDSKNDPKLLVSALCERQIYVTSYLKKHNEAIKRLKNIKYFKNLTTYNEIIKFASSINLKWFILHPDDYIRWPKSLVDYPIYSYKGFKVFCF